MLLHNLCTRLPEYTALHLTDRNPHNLGRKTFFRDDFLFNKIAIIMETECLSPKLRNNPTISYLLLKYTNLFQAFSY